MAAIRHSVLGQTLQSILKRRILRTRWQRKPKTPEYTHYSQKAEFRPIIHFGVDDRYSDKLRPGYTKPSMGLDILNHSCVLIFRQETFSCELRTDEGYKPVASFLRAFLIWHSHQASVFLSKQSVLFVRHIVWLYVTAAAAAEKNIVTEVVAVWDKAVQLKDGPLLQ